jgi:hypothetical protein
MQVMETYSKDKSQPNLITHIKVESANQSDANALIPAIEDAQSKELAPTELLADTLYGSDSNIEQAKELGVTVIAPVMGQKERNAIRLTSRPAFPGGLVEPQVESYFPLRIEEELRFILPADMDCSSRRRLFVKSSHLLGCDF